jgi:hypothetical protein
LYIICVLTNLHFKRKIEINAAVVSISVKVLPYS